VLIIVNGRFRLPPWMKNSMRKRGIGMIFGECTWLQYQALERFDLAYCVLLVGWLALDGTMVSHHQSLLCPV